MKYINHDTAAADDEKLAELIINFGYEGYGLWWATLEKLGKQEKPVKTSVLKKQLNVGKRLDKCWSFMESIGLLCSLNGETFNMQLLNYAGKYKIKKEKTAEKVSEWRKNQEDEKNVTSYESECNQPKVKESKVKEIKEKESKDSTAAIASDGESLDSKKVTPHWEHHKKIWIDFYKERFDGLEPSFNGASVTALKTILTRLQKQSAITQRTKDLPWSEDYAGKVFTHFLTKAYADQWRSQNFRLTILSSHYDSIITGNDTANTKNGKQATGANVDTGSAFAAIDRHFGKT